MNEKFSLRKEKKNKIFSYTLCFFSIIVILLFLNAWHINTITRRYGEVPQAYVQSCKFQTGDILLFQHKKYQFSILGLDNLMSHMGAIIEDSLHGSLCVDFNPTLRGAFETMGHVKPVISLGNLQLLKIKDVVDNYPGIVLVRPILKPMTENQKFLFKKTILTTLINLEYSQDVIQKCPLTYLPLVFSSLIPEASAFFAHYFSSLYSTRVSTFCTEGVALAFQEAGILKNEKYTNIRGPISWMHGMVPEFTLIWGKEIQLV